MWLLFLPVVWWAGAITACAIKPDTNLLQILQVLTEKLDQPFSISYTPYTLRCVFTFTIAYGESLCMMAEDGTKEIGLCRFVDGKQVDVNGQIWEIGEFLWQMERRGIQVYPLETA